MKESFVTGYIFRKKCSLVEEVETEYGISSLTKDFNITKTQMEICCQHLLQDSRNIGVNLEGCRVHIATFYSVMSDGQICIPWNWTGTYAPEDSKVT